MKIYHQKKRWKIVLAVAAFIIVAISLWYSNLLVEQIARDERRNIAIWADAIRNRVQMVQYTQILFEQIKNEERKRVELLAETYKRIGETENSDQLNFYLRIIANNTTIPVIITNSKGDILESGNIDEDISGFHRLEGRLREQFSTYDPVVVRLYQEEYIYVYYKDSKTFTELREYLDEMVATFFSEVVANSVSVPVLITDSLKTQAIAWGNLDEGVVSDPEGITHLIREMESENEPMAIDFGEQGKRYIFYKSSYLLTQLRYYPYFQLGIIFIFLIVAYLLFSTARNAEQNQVWVGLAKETAHQLGTPLSALMAWVEMLKIKGVDEETITELNKDIRRLQTIAERFSKIGSASNLQPHDLREIVQNAVSYMELRSSKKITTSLHCPPDKPYVVPLNPQLFEWVIENLWNNATDAMSGKGHIDIRVSDEGDFVALDFSDNGKGINKSKFNNVFKPGYTSKQRGWGLGLSLSRRIVEGYHRGRIFVKSSTPGKGTTFRVMLRK